MVALYDRLEYVDGLVECSQGRSCAGPFNLAQVSDPTQLVHRKKMK